MLIIFTIASIVAAVCVSRDDALVASCIWSISNIGFIWHNLVIEEYEMVLLFMVCWIVAVYGVYNLKVKKRIEVKT